MLRAGTFVVCAGLLALLPAHPAVAAWPTDPNLNVPLCTTAWEELSPQIVSDGAGGAIVAWQDSRTGQGRWDIYAQRISADGAVVWTPDGEAICIRGTSDFPPTLRIVSDGVGGAIVIWSDYRNDEYAIYAQRISSGGTVLWANCGVVVSPGGSPFSVASDGAGGAMVAWGDPRNGTDSDIYAQRISAGGTVQWADSGVALCTTTGNQEVPVIVSDGAGGAIVTWYDFRQARNKVDIYARRVSAEGTAMWADGGIAIYTAIPNLVVPGGSPAIASDGAGGAIVAWHDMRHGGSNSDIYAQRASADGTVMWADSGVALCTAAGDQYSTAIVSDGAGGAVVTWVDGRGSSRDIYAQRISATGTVHWAGNGVALCTATGNQLYPAIAVDGAGGAIVAWMDPRNGYGDIYAQRISLGGAVLWAANGVALCTATGSQARPAIVSDGTYGAIVTWEDWRSGMAQADIYAQNVLWNGELGAYSGASVADDAPVAFALDPVRPNPARDGVLTVHFSLPTAAPARLELLDVAGRRIASHEVGAGQHTLDLGVGQHLAPGLYLVRLTQGANTLTTRAAVLR